MPLVKSGIMLPDCTLIVSSKRRAMVVTRPSLCLCLLCVSVCFENRGYTLPWLYFLAVM